jgi:DNA-binding PadR family transcriptional regulator
LQKIGLDTVPTGSYSYKVEIQRRVKAMPKGDLLGAFEQHVLLALIRLGDNAYGMTIRRQIEEKTKRSVSLGAVYATLDRLESKNYICSRDGTDTPERAGRARRYFRIEPSGLLALDDALHAIDTLRAGLPARLAPDRC